MPIAFANNSPIIVIGDAGGSDGGGGGDGGGTVTSVALTVPTGFSVSGGPITGHGTLAISLSSQSGNKFLASPANGSSGTPAFRAMAKADLPSLSATDITNAANTASSATFTGALAASNLSGTNTGDQTITLSGDVSGSGTSALSTTIGSGKVTNAMLAGSIAASKLVGTDIATVGTITSGTWSGTTLAVNKGGTGQTSAANAINALVPTQTGNSGKYLTTDGSIVAWGSTASGTVTSVDLTVPTGFSVSGGPVTASGTLAVSLSSQSGNKVLISPSNGTSGTPGFRALVVADLPDLAASDIDGAADTGSSATFTGALAASNLSGTNTGDQTVTLSGDVSGSGTGAITATIGSGKVTNTMLAGSIAASKLVGTDIATVGTITSGTWSGTTIAVNKGGTGQTSAANAINALLPTQTGNSGKYLTTDGSAASWDSIVGGGGGTVTSVDMTVPVGFSVAGNPVTDSGSLDITLDAQSGNKVLISPANGSSGTPAFRSLAIADLPDLTASDIVDAADLGGDAEFEGNLSAVNLSGTNTGDQTITLSGDVSGSGTGAITATIGSGKVTNTMLAGSIAASKLVGTDIATVGTVTSGTWSASTIAVNKGGTGQTSASAAINALVPAQTGNSGKFLSTDGSAVAWEDASGAGTVISVDMTVPVGFSVTGNPVTGTGSLDVTLDAQAGNVFLASPDDGGSGVPAFRSLVIADLPPLSAADISDAADTSSDAAFVGALSAANLSGTNTGDQTITLSGDVSGSGTDTITTTIGSGTVTDDMLAGSIAASNLIGTDIDTVGTVTSGVWHGDVLDITYGGTGQTSAGDAINALVPAQGANDGKFLSTDGVSVSWQGAGTVTSVDMTVPPGFSVGGGPVTDSGSLDVTLDDQSGNKVLASPEDGDSGPPTFRTLVKADLPALAASDITAAADTSGDAAFAGNLSAANLSGTNTGDQTITLTGDVTGSGMGSFAATIGSGKVTNAMLAGSIAASKLVGTDIATVGTVTSGTWSAGTIAVNKGGTGQTTKAAALVALLPDLAGEAGSVLTVQGGEASVAWDTPTTGTVTSVSATVPTGFTVSGSPVTTSGTLAVTLDSQSGNKALISPSNGSSGTPGFRALVKADLPTLSASDITNAADTSGSYSNPSWITALADTKVLPTMTGQSGKVLGNNGSASAWQAATSGTVTSVAFTPTPGFGVSGSPVTTSGTLAVTPTVTSPSQITSNQNDYAPSAGILQRWNTDASRNVTGMVAGTTGEERLICNVGSFNIVLVHQSASSSSNNRWLSTTGADLTIPANGMARAVYDGTTLKWRVTLEVPVDLSSAAATGTLAAGRFPALTSDVTTSAGSLTTTIANNAVTTAKINNDAVTYAKIQNVSATSRLLGRKTASAGDTEECTISEALGFLSTTQGVIPYCGSSSTWAALGTGTSGQFLKTQGAAANPVWADVSIAANTQTFTSSGTWTKPTGKTWALIYVVGGGGGGGSGARFDSGYTYTKGGGGGGGGGITKWLFNMSDLSSTESVTIGTGGAGASAITSDNTIGGTGSDGGFSFFGPLCARNGSGGRSDPSGGGGIGGTGGEGYLVGNSGPGGGLPTDLGAGTTGGGTFSGGNGDRFILDGCCGGGCGGEISTGVASTGYTGGRCWLDPVISQTYRLQGGNGGTTGGGTGSVGQGRTTTNILSTGGGGGGGNTSGAGGTGGAGGNYGAGGGGGGASYNGSNSGAGGAGSNGFVMVISY